MKKRILTGDRPTGQLHIGHFFGALQDRVALQDKYDTFIIIADVQALTDNFQNSEKIQKNVFEVTIDNLAAGIDPNKSTFFIQSLIPEIAELTIFFSNLVTITRLQGNPTVKEEIEQKKELFRDSVTFGFLGYPVSQAADIAIFRADLVPVGEDQLPQIEQTREIIRKFNRLYGQTFKEPQAKVSRFPRVKGLDGKKMGKSLNNAIYLADSPEIIKKKVNSAITDPKKIHLRDKGHPDICLVYNYHKMFSLNKLETIKNECQAGIRGCVQCKKELAENIVKMLKPIQKKRRYFQKRPKIVREILFEGTKKARKTAKETMKLVKEKMRLNYFC